MKTTGTKYEATSDLTTTEIAKLVRADIKAAVKTGDLPVGIYSVRTRYASQMSAIDITVKSIECDVLNPGRIYAQSDTPDDFDAISKHETYTQEYKAVSEHLTAILNDYNRKDIDSQSDLHNVRFFSSVKISYICRGDEEMRILVNRPQPTDSEMLAESHALVDAHELGDNSAIEQACDRGEALHVVRIRRTQDSTEESSHDDDIAETVNLVREGEISRLKGLIAKKETKAEENEIKAANCRASKHDDSAELREKYARKCRALAALYRSMLSAIELPERISAQL